VTATAQGASLAYSGEPLTDRRITLALAGS